MVAPHAVLAASGPAVGPRPLGGAPSCGFLGDPRVRGLAGCVQRKVLPRSHKLHQVSLHQPVGALCTTRLALV